MRTPPWTRRVVEWRWEDPDSQRVFARWVGFPPEEVSVREVAQMEALLGLSPPAHVLDLGCGTGRHAVELARRGYAVVGIDVADCYLKEAQALAIDTGVSVEFRCQRGSELSDVGRFDAVVAYNHTLGFMSDDELTIHFRRARASLRKANHRLLLRFAGPRLSPDLVDTKREWRDWAEQDGHFILSQHAIADGFRDETTIVIDPDVAEIVEFRERQRVLTVEAVSALLEAAGFRASQLLPGPPGHSPRARRTRGLHCEIGGSVTNPAPHRQGPH